MIKQIMVNTRLGALAIELRDRVGLQVQTWRNLETVGGIANDILARVLVERLCRDAAVFVDVGAHLGSIINGVRQHSLPSQIIAVEAIPEKAKKLAMKFPEVHIHCCAAGDREGEVTFYVDHLQSGYSSLDSAISNRSETKEITVNMKTLDRLVGKAEVDLIKIDVEGAELGVLKGADYLVSQSRPTIMFESGASEMQPYTKAAMWHWFNDHQYELFLPNRVAHDGPGLTLDAFLHAHLYPRLTTNYFAVAAERRAAVRSRARQVLNLN